MEIIKGNIWTYYDTGHKPICITTNCICKSDDSLVMGKGIALEAAKRFPTLPLFLGRNVRLYGNKPFYEEALKVISFPTKNHWKDDSDIKLIENSTKLIKLIVNIFEIRHIYSPWPGCGNGNLTKSQVSPILSKIWNDNRFIILEP